MKKANKLSVFIVFVASILTSCQNGGFGRSYNISYNLMGGEGSYKTTTTTGEYVVPEEKPTLEGMNFVGWNTFDDETVYQSGKTYQVSKSMTLYAMWTKFEVCWHCAGQGWQKENGAFECEDCHGEGHTDEKIVTTCNTCNGKGTVSGDQTCPVCNGSKYVSTTLQCYKCHRVWTIPYSGASIYDFYCPSCGTGAPNILYHTQCSYCNGYGSVAGTYTCPTCYGKGSSESYKECSTCKGTGTLSGLCTCYVCTGVGYKLSSPYSYGPRVIEVNETTVRISPASAQIYEWCWVETNDKRNHLYAGEYSLYSSKLNWGTQSEISYTISTEDRYFNYSLFFREKQTSERPFKEMHAYSFIAALIRGGSYSEARMTESYQNAPAI